MDEIREWGDPRAEVLNLSLTGAAVETTARPSFGGRYRLCFARGAARLEAAARVVRCALRRMRPGPGGEAEAVYEVGFEFEEVLGRNGREILQFMDGNAVVGPGFRVVDRFALEEGTRVEMVELDPACPVPDDSALAGGLAHEPG